MTQYIETCRLYNCASVLVVGLSNNSGEMCQKSPEENERKEKV
jgi:hypothetical protein